eukprot:tig00000489_g1371.t1
MAKAGEDAWFDSSAIAPGSTGRSAGRPPLDVETGGAPTVASGDMRSTATQLLMGHALDQVRQRASAWKVLIGNIDPLRPYFDLDSAEVLKRFMYSLVPRPALSHATMVAAPDFYGPLVSSFTFGMLLHMLLGGSEVKEGTLLGTSLGVCLTYWMVASGFYWTVSYILQCELRLQSVVCLTGYAMSGYCATIAAQLLFGSALGGLAAFVAGGLSAAALGLAFYHSHPEGRKGLMAAALVAAVHFLFLLFIRYQYFPSNTQVTRGAPEAAPGAGAEEGKGQEERHEKQDDEKHEKEKGGKEKDDKDRLFF